MATPSSVPIEIASVIQSASIQRHPSPRHDINPSTAASVKQPVTFSPGFVPDAEENADEIPISVLRPVPRRSTLPPLPDLRFEQSYLRSIAQCETRLAVAWVTLRDQVVLALAQGFMLSLLAAGWRHMNRAGAGRFSGRSVGSRLRRWWWGVNGWTIPSDRAADNRKELGAQVGEFYQAKFASGGGD